MIFFVRPDAEAREERHGSLHRLAEQGWPRRFFLFFHREAAADYGLVTRHWGLGDPPADRNKTGDPP
jgi:hypothetical protein